MIYELFFFAFFLKKFDYILLIYNCALHKIMVSLKAFNTFLFFLQL